LQDFARPVRPPSPKKLINTPRPYSINAVSSSGFHFCYHAFIVHFHLPFGWNHLPTSNMNANTVYMIITAMLKNFYNYLLKKVSEVFTDILPTSRLKRFIFRFIAVSGRYVYQGRQWILQLYTNRPYEKICG